MNSLANLRSLNISQLEVLLSNLKLGKSHLGKYLTTAQLRILLEINKIAKNKKLMIKSNNLERRGNVVLLVNTIFTSILGGCLGYSAFGSFDINNFSILLMISGLIGIVSAIIGRVSYNLTLETAREAITEQKLVLLQTKILHIAKKKLKIANQKLIDLLNQFISPCQPQEFDSANSFSQWLNHFKEKINEMKKVLPEKQLVKLKEISNEIDQLSQDEFWLKNLLAYNLKLEIDSNLSKHGSIDKLEVNYVINVLTNLHSDPAEILKEQFRETKPWSWWKDNHKDITVGLFPTLLGGGASLFVFFTGIPDIAKKLNLHFFHACLTTPWVRQIESYLFFAITLYFGFAYLYNQKKSFERKRQIALSKQIVTHQEISYMKLRRRWRSLKKLTHQIEKLQLILAF